MIYKNTAIDFFYTTSADTLSYYITCDGVQIYSGTAVKSPDEPYMRINVGRRVSDYLTTSMPDFREFDGVVVPHPEQLRDFILYDSEGTQLEEYRVLYDFSEGWDGSTDDLSEPIDGKADVRQKIFWGIFSASGDTVPLDTEDSGGGGGDPGEYTGMCLTFEIISGTSVFWLNRSETPEGGGAIQYSKDNGATWVSLPSYSYVTTANTISVSPGDKVLFKGNSTYGFGNMQERHFSSDCVLNVYGNLASMNGWSNVCPKSGFVEFFYHYNSDYDAGTGMSIVSAENLVIPYTEVKESGLQGLFMGCKMLTKVPKTLPATTLGRLCYANMFLGCESLTEAPILPATTMKELCYSGMFNGCTSLEYPPELPSTGLAYGCYTTMFANCTSLKEAPYLPADWLTERCYSSMFNGCTSLKKAPDLIASTLWERCYWRMFKDSGVKYIKCLAQYVVDGATECTYQWVDNVPATGTFVKKTGSNIWSSGINGIPVGWTVENI